ncbi:hypothetical protein SNE25_17445 [Mucilaginibacter sabulilitoris]|uniref:Uncharacterized protein n=1 Tax=Mucilaginibacter sabulilitoris TaxID=1173583 RepID=A0ABZ0TDR9_9SPHI|nr:hypothetical protein [Mucilaginibacter sabulilitoris]WPU91107.1 hypothetical protein SNE25_17445 [Mucilaginibacter sabulilitoris]
MLENKLSALRATFNFVRYAFLPILILAAIGGFKFFKVTEEQIPSYIIFSIIACLAIYGYLYFRYFLLLKALGNYLNALKRKDFAQALNFGRMYYSMSRKGILGADGRGLTIYDESAINNDISAYSKAI